MKAKTGLLISVISLFALVGCGGGESAPVEKTTYTDKTENSIYGKLSDFSIAPDQVKAGDTLTFKAKAEKYFDVATPTNNGVPCTLVSEDKENGTAIFSTTIVAGANNLKGVYTVQKDVDFVDEYKLNISSGSL